MRASAASISSPNWAWPGIGCGCTISTTRGLPTIRAHGGVDVEPGGLAAVENATTDLPAAVDGAEIIIVVTGGNAQEAVARSLAPLLRDGQIILLIQGNTGGSLVVRRALDAAGCRADVDVAEMDNYPFSCWRLEPTRIRPIVKKRWLQIASFPAADIDRVFRAPGAAVPACGRRAERDPTGFTNANAMLHVANCVGNAGKIDRGESYRFYADGVTPSVARLYPAINAERVAVAAALGASVPTLEDWFDRVYGVRGADLVETCQLLTTNSRRPVSGDRHTKVVRPQIHHRGRAGRPDADERTWCRGRRADARDRCARHAGARHDRQGFFRAGTHAGTHGTGGHGCSRRSGRFVEKGFA